jgi:uncharacterized membrane protein
MLKVRVGTFIIIKKKEIKKILKYLLLTLFGVNCIMSFFNKNYDSMFGWACAFVCEAEILSLKQKLKEIE